MEKRNPGKEKGSSKDEVMENTHTFFCGNPAVELRKGTMTVFTNKNPARSPLVVMTVPESFVLTCHLCQFLTPYADTIRGVRLLRSPDDTLYALIKFDELVYADDFLLENHNIPLSILDNKPCLVEYVKTVELVEGSVLVTLDQALGGHENVVGDVETVCSLCLEPMSHGTLTMLCNHQFHASCLIKYEDNKCPICRHCVDTDIESAACGVCGALRAQTDSLWLCISCGHIGCSRFSGGHARQHFEQTGHPYSMDLATQQVWDYSRDIYIHRLILDKKNSEIVEVEGPQSERTLDEAQLEALSSEYGYLLHAHIKEMRYTHSQKMEALNQAFANEREALQSANSVQKNRIISLEKKLTATRAKATSAENDCALYKQLNESLLTRLRLAEEKYEALVATHSHCEQTIADLKDENRDLMVFLEVGETVRNSGMAQELQSGHTFVPQPEEPKPRRRKKR